MPLKLKLHVTAADNFPRRAGKWAEIMGPSCQTTSCLRVKFDGYKTWETWHIGHFDWKNPKVVKG